MYYKWIYIILFIESSLVLRSPSVKGGARGVVATFSSLLKKFNDASKDDAG